MKKEEIQTLFKSFEDAVCMMDTIECWRARELQELLGYRLWQNFFNVVNKAKVACENVGQQVTDHFIDANKMVRIGSGTNRQVDDVILTRYACYLVAQNGDLFERGVNDQTFAVIRSKGDQALFRLSTSMMKNRLGVPQSRPLADFLPTISIKAKDFAAEMTSVNVQTKNLQGEEPITQEHVDNNTAVRKMLTERGIVPEDLPPAEDVKKVERRLASEEKKMLRNKKT